MKQKNAYLELLRFIFAVLICLYHWGKGHFRGAYVGVQFFFVLSGFMLAKSYFDNLVTLRKQNICENCVSFLKAKIIRYYPHFIFSLIVLSIIKVMILKLMTFNEFLKIFFAILIISAFLNNSLLSMIFNKYIRKLSMFCGRLSYPVFLNHMAVLYILNSPKYTGGGYTERTALFLLTTIIYSVMTEKIVGLLSSAVKK